MGKMTDLKKHIVHGLAMLLFVGAAVSSAWGAAPDSWRNPITTNETSGADSDNPTESDPVDCISGNV